MLSCPVAHRQDHEWGHPDDCKLQQGTRQAHLPLKGSQRQGSCIIIRQAASGPSLAFTPFLGLAAYAVSRTLCTAASCHVG